MTRYPILLLLLFVPFLSKGQTMEAAQKETIAAALEEMRAADQHYRNFISYGTFDKHFIDSMNNLEMDQVIAYMQQRKPLAQEVQDSLWKLQNTVDYANIEKLQLIVQLYGWPSEEDFGKENDPFVLLLHTPTILLEETKELLLPEVIAGRLEAEQYAMFVDNMRMKHGERQLYGTNIEFDRVQMREMPPTIEDPVATNAARERIGLAPLKEGEFRLPRN